VAVDAPTSLTTSAAAGDAASAPKKVRTVRRLRNNAGVNAAAAKRKARDAAPPEIAPVSQERIDKELVGALKFKKMAAKIAADFEADDAMEALGMGMGSAQQTQRVRNKLMGVDADGEVAAGEPSLVPRSMLEEVAQARRSQNQEKEAKTREEAEGEEQGEKPKTKKSTHGGGGEEGSNGEDTGVSEGEHAEVEAAAAIRSAAVMVRSDPNETPGQRLKRLFCEKRERGLTRVREKFANKEMFDQLAGPSLGALVGDDGGGVDQSQRIFGEAANASQANKAMLAEDVEEDGEGGVRANGGGAGLLQGGGNGLSPNNSIDPFKLIPGEFVVHRKYGIGKFLGIRSIAEDAPLGADGQPSGPAPRVGYLFIQYADNQAKIKPEKASEQLYRYASPGAIKAGVKPPKLSRIQDRKGWQQREANTKKHIRQLVVNQMCVYLQRLQCVREPYMPPPDEVYQRFNELFPFKLTPDQAMAVSDCYEDLSQRDTPMDRIVVGDVGFGKTEVGGFPRPPHP